MELKQLWVAWVHSCYFLLIVPYGIETILTAAFLLLQLSFNRTLWNWNVCIYPVIKFVTSFNRTLWNWNIVSWVVWVIVLGLLIVPYGIETWSFIAFSWLFMLLIVPYGIETALCFCCLHSMHSFNRTLWNWNCQTS